MDQVPPLQTVPDLADLRRAAVLSQKDLCKMSGVSVPTICGTERGRHQARPSIIRKLAAALGVSPQMIAHACAESYRRGQVEIAERVKP